MIHVAFRRVIASRVAGNGLVATAPIEGAGPKINDDLGSFFSKSAVDHAMGRLLKIYSRFKVEVVIETFSSIPDNMKAQYQPDAKAEFFRRWAVMRTDDEARQRHLRPDLQESGIPANRTRQVDPQEGLHARQSAMRW